MSLAESRGQDVSSARVMPSLNGNLYMQWLAQHPCFSGQQLTPAAAVACMHTYATSWELGAAGGVCRPSMSSHRPKVDGSGDILYKQKRRRMVHLPACKTRQLPCHGQPAAFRPRAGRTMSKAMHMKCCQCHREGTMPCWMSWLRPVIPCTIFKSLLSFPERVWAHPGLNTGPTQVSATYIQTSHCNTVSTSASSPAVPAPAAAAAPCGMPQRAASPAPCACPRSPAQQRCPTPACPGQPTSPPPSLHPLSGCPAMPARPRQLPAAAPSRPTPARPSRLCLHP